MNASEATAPDITSPRRAAAVPSSPLPRRLRILHILPYYRPAYRYGGPVVSVHSLARAQAERGHEVHVFTTDIDGPERLDVPLETIVEIDGVAVTYFPAGWLRRLFYAPRMAAALRRSVAGFDIVHLHTVWLWPTTYAAHIARRENVAYVIAPRGMLVPEMIRRKSTLIKRFWLALLERRNVEAASAVHVTSDLEATDLAALGLRPRRVVVLPNGVETPPAGVVGNDLQAGGSCRPFVLALGRVHWKKGLDRLIRALAFAPSLDLVIAGNDEDGYVARLESLALELGIRERVHFRGPVYGDGKWSLLASARLLALPSYSENFGNVVLEAMAVGRPIAVTPEVGVAEIVQRVRCGIVADGEPRVFGEAIAALAVDEHSCSLMGERGRQAVAEQYAWDAIAAQSEELYAHCLPVTHARKECL